NAAEKGYNFIESNDFFANLEENMSLQSTHGAPDELKIPPKQFRTRELLCHLQAVLSLHKSGVQNLEGKAVSLTEKILSRQILESDAEYSLFGHFYTFDGFDFSEKANYHCGAWDLPYKNYNQGAHKPYWVMPLFEMMELFSNENLTLKIKEALKKFAYGFFKPACFDNPFLILPAGVYKKHGVLYFGGWYHGHAKIYGYAAVLAMKFYRYFNDEDFLNIATANMQWIAGLNLGGISFIVDIGENFAKDWNVLRGTIVNGFSSSKQFSIAPVSKETDLPSFLDDEGGIHHCAGFISGLCSMNL
ncbi:MAG: glycoside hydrolase family 9 protein, partial [Clostridia bacterium]|nr:glycoside hydrolase family 9 protein [Clostridia bacterium]